MAPKKRAVVVGGAGFIGSHLTDALVGGGWTVDVIDDLSGGKAENVHDEATLHKLDIKKYADIAPIIKGADALFHLAALPRVQYSIEHPRETHETNVVGTLNVLLAAKEGGVRRVVYSASSSAYGDSEKLPLSEDMPARPVSPYGLQKFIGEEYARLFSFLYGLETVSLRYFNVYGTRMNADGAYALVMGVWLKQLAAGEPMTITGDGTQSRDFTHVSDVVQANLRAAESKKVGKGEVMNIGAGKNVALNDLVKLFGEKFTYIPPRIEPKHTLADNRLAKELIGWAPAMRLEDGVHELLHEWGLSH